MCGISGFVKYRERISGSDEDTLHKMNAKLSHRGPDANDVLVFDNVGLGFTRLSIVGLENGMQPIFNEDESLVLICNGEIFNYIELKKILSGKGHTFRTRSDVEVILHLYEEKGTGFLNDLNGQFAFALFDKKKQQLFCARDPMGILPFFYILTADLFLFASEIKALLEHPSVKASIDLVGLDQVFTFPGLISPRTMFRQVRSLENGHFLLIDKMGRLTDCEYWDLPLNPKYPVAGEMTESGYLHELEYLFEDAVRLRLRADVPTGLYLSGGLDSSLIAMKVKQLSGEQRQKAFSIDFTDSEFSESAYQNIIARECHADLYQKVFHDNDVSERLRQAIYHCECPIKESYNTASLHLSKAVRDKKMKVILSGEGADEFFAGYVGYRFDKLRLHSLMKHPVSQEEYDTRNKVWGDGAFFYESNFVESEQLRWNIYSDEVRANFKEINCLNHYIIDPEKLRGRDILNKRSYVDYKLRLVDHLISDHGDRMAMANSVEVRYPFLDKNIVEFAARVPSDLKLNEFTEKYLLRKMAEKCLPEEIRNREKFGFVAPGSPSLLRAKIGYIDDLLSYETIRRQGYFNADYIERLKKKYSEDGFKVNTPFETDLLIIVITFGILLEQFIDNR
jgi:asparagine synthase (glutamine-hydrolysing)